MAASLPNTTTDFMKFTSINLILLNLMWSLAILLGAGAALLEMSSWVKAHQNQAAISHATNATELLVFDWNRPATEDDRGFPKNDPPREEANGDWTTPVNFAQGKVYFRAEIRSQPEPQDMLLQFCFWQYNFSLETCGRTKSVRGEPGTIVTWSQAIEDMWQLNNEPLDWENPRQRVAIAIKNMNKDPVSDYNDWNWNGEDPTLWYPLDLRFTVVVVAQGESFSGWSNYVGGSPLPTLTPTATPTDTPEPTFSPTNTPQPTATSTNTPEPTFTATYTPTVTESPTLAPTETPEHTSTSTATATLTPSPTRTPTQTATDVPTTTAPAMSVPTATADPRNQIRNPGFENGRNSWHFSGSEGVFEVVTTGDGNHAASITLLDGSARAQFYQRSILLMPNFRYRLRFAAYATGNRSTKLLLMRYGEMEGDAVLQDLSLTLTGEWQVHEFELNTTSLVQTTNDLALVFTFDATVSHGVNNATHDVYWLDDVRLVPIGSVENTPTPTQTQTATFENRPTTPPTSTIMPPATATPTATLEATFTSTPSMTPPMTPTPTPTTVSPDGNQVENVTTATPKPSPSESLYFPFVTR